MKIEKEYNIFEKEKNCVRKKLYKTMALNAKNSIHRYSKEVFAADILKIYYKAIEVKKNKAKK